MHGGLRRRGSAVGVFGWPSPCRCYLGPSPHLGLWTHGETSPLLLKTLKIWFVPFLSVTEASEVMSDKLFSTEHTNFLTFTHRRRRGSKILLLGVFVIVIIACFVCYFVAVAFHFHASHDFSRSFVRPPLSLPCYLSCLSGGPPLGRGSKTRQLHNF